MAEVIKVFMNPETLTTLEDHFIDDKKKKTLHTTQKTQVKNYRKVS